MENPAGRRDFVRRIRFGRVLLSFGLPTPAIVGFVAAYLAGGFYPAEEVWERLQKRTIDVHFLMLFVAAGAASIGAWAEGATLLFLFRSPARSNITRSAARRRKSARCFATRRKSPRRLTPREAEREVKVEKLRRGMRLLIKPGAQFPVDGEIAKGSTAADESNLTGEATPVEKTSATLRWPAPSICGARSKSWSPGRPPKARCKKSSRSSARRSSKKRRRRMFADKFSTYYTYGVLGLSFAMFFVWWLGFRLAAFKSTVESHSAFYRTMTLLVVSSPCALVLSIPSAVLAAIAWGARHGILFRGGAAVEKLAEVNVVALDKTGTLTTGELRVETAGKFSARTRKRNRAACLFAGKTFDASAGPRHHAPRQAARIGTLDSRSLNPSPAKA